MLRMRPHCRFFMPGTAARMVWNDDDRLMAMTASHFSIGKSSILATCWMPAAAQNPDTFVIKIALPTPTIHVGDVLAIEETLSNPTDHVVVAGSEIGRE